MQDFGHYMLETGALPTAELARLHTAITESPLLGPNPLNQYFRSTTGYSVVFRREALADVIARFPEFTAFLDRALSPMANAFYLNPLVIPDGGHVGRHADLSLRSYAPSVANPSFVSVLYVRVPPEMQGGQLQLFAPDDRCLSTITPEAGTLLTFQGDLRHAVTAVRTAVSAPRVSLVCEQYCLDVPLLAEIPRLTVQSQGGFNAFLTLQDG
ncbi:MAG: 2OG-Fe(II) oxygenase [Candidatus Sericytochromatia bacterium]|nr:2OG-Fe(II) oxygenase [Candidatus Sericytochromatia bacterium]